jgi:hypothetical protein
MNKEKTVSETKVRDILDFHTTRDFNAKFNKDDFNYFISDLRTLLIEGLPKKYNETYVGEGLSLSYIFGYNEALKDVKSAIDRLLK